jgi:thiamine pyrophosphate-dependent acetolactate synthase large subunit-like protein
MFQADRKFATQILEPEIIPGGRAQGIQGFTEPKPGAVFIDFPEKAYRRGRFDKQPIVFRAPLPGKPAHKLDQAATLIPSARRGRR